MLYKPTTASVVTCSPIRPRGGGSGLEADSPLFPLDGSSRAALKYLHSSAGGASETSTELTYRALSAAVASFGRAFATLHDVSPSLVATACPASAPFEYVVAVLGLTSIGLAFVPLRLVAGVAADEMARHADLASCIVAADVSKLAWPTAAEDAQLVATASGVAASLDIRVHMLSIGVPDGRVALETAREASAAPPRLRIPAELGGFALLMYTTGSTGKPKGVPLTRANLASSVGACARTYGLRSTDVTLLTQPTCTIGGLVTPLLAMLAAGGTVVLAPFDPTRHWERVRAHRVSWYTGVPEMHRQVVQHHQATGAPPPGHCVRFVRNGSGALAQPLVEAMRELFGTAVVVAYGMTEAAQLVCANPADAPRDGSVGKPAVELRLFNTDDDDGDGAAPTPVVEPNGEGEVCISGPSIFGGYVEAVPPRGGMRLMEGENAGCFFAHADRRWFRTGDIARVDGDGYVFIVGRRKNMIKVNGYKVFPEVIEDALAKAVGSGVKFVCVPMDRDVINASGDAAGGAKDGAGHAAGANATLAILAWSTNGRPLDETELCELIVTTSAYGRAFPTPTHLAVVPDAALILTAMSAKVDRKKATACAHSLPLRAIYDTLFGQAPSAEDPAACCDLVVRVTQRVVDAMHGPGAVAVSVDTHIAAAGLSSIHLITMAAILSDRLLVGAGTPLSVAHLLSNVSIAELVRRFLGCGAPPVQPGRRLEPAASRLLSVFVGGASCRLPGSCNSLEAVAEALADKRIGIIMNQAWRAQGVSEMLAQAGFLHDAELCDHALFGLSAYEIEHIDSQQTLVLEGVYEAICDGGDAPSALSGERVAIIVGCNHADSELALYASMPASCPPNIRASKALSAIPGRVCQLLNFTGPAVTTDAACASGLAAFDYASLLLRTDACRTAGAAGVNRITNANVSVSMATSNMLSPTSRCRTWDSSCDGFVRGEGCVALLLHSSTEDERQSWCAAEVLSVASAHNGRTQHMTYPDVRGQEQLVQAAVATAGISATEMAFIEAHGTATKVGDATEISALESVFRSARPANSATSHAPVSIGSIKANIGHLEGCAGAAGLFRLLCTLRTRTVAPNAALITPSLDVKRVVAASLLAFPTKPTALTPDPTDTAHVGVSSFGFNGTIAHAILRSVPPDSVEVRLAKPCTRGVAFVYSSDCPLPDAARLAKLHAACSAYRSAVEEFSMAADEASRLVLSGQSDGHDAALAVRIAYQFCLTRTWEAHGVSATHLLAADPGASHLVDWLHGRKSASSVWEALRTTPWRVPSASPAGKSTCLADIRDSACKVVVLMSNLDNSGDLAQALLRADDGHAVLQGFGEDVFQQIALGSRYRTFRLQQVRATMPTAVQSEDVRNKILAMLALVDYSEGEEPSMDVPLSDLLDSMQIAMLATCFVEAFPQSQFDMDATIAALAASVESRPAPEPRTENWSSADVRQLNRDASNRLICVHGIDGDPKFLIFRSLARALDGVLELHAIRCGAAALACETVKEVARLYNRMTKDLVAEASHVNLLGHSFGGVIAHQMASLLEQQGVSVRLILGDFEVAYPPERFSSFNRTQNAARVFIGAWEGPSIEAYKLAIRRHLLFSKDADTGYCTALLCPADENAAREREGDLAGFVHGKLRPTGFTEQQWSSLIQEWAICMAFHERIVMASSATTEEQRIEAAGFFADHVYTASMLGSSTLLLRSESPEFAACVEVNSKFCAAMQVRPIPGHTHYNLMEDGSVLPHAISDFVLDRQQQAEPDQCHAEDYQESASLGSLLMDQARAQAHAIFLQAWKGGDGVTLSLTFRVFAARVVAATASLKSHGIAHGDRIAVLSPPTVQFYICAFALMAMGCTCALLNWREPSKTLAGMVADSMCTVLLSSAEYTQQADEIFQAVSLERLLWLDQPHREPRSVMHADAIDHMLPAFDGPVDLNDPRDAEWDGLSVDRLQSDTPALIMFTSGSTFKPKAVPFTHGNLLWSLQYNQQQRDCLPAEVVKRPGAGTLSFLPNFHVVGFINNFLSNLYGGLRCAVLRDAGSSLLTPQTLLEACVDLQPVLIDSVPVMVEGLLRLLESGHASDEERAAVTQVHAIMAGGCQLNEELLPLARKHSVRLITHYGLTEGGGGAPMFGGLANNLNAVRPLDAARAILVDDDGNEVTDEGELVFLGLRSATAGYIGLSSDKLTHGKAQPTSHRLHTGDIFRRIAPGFYQHVCRRDDLVVLKTGEMTNPLPIEAALELKCGHVIANLCIFGQGQARPFVVIEGREGVDTDAARASVQQALQSINATQAEYSRIPARHVIWADSPLPASSKGNVIRSQVEVLYQNATADLARRFASAVVADANLRSVLAVVERAAGHAVSADAPLMDAGIDSLSVVDLADEIQRIAGDGVRLTSTLLFELSTTRAIMAHVLEQTTPSSETLAGVPTDAHLPVTEMQGRQGVVSTAPPEAAETSDDASLRALIQQALPAAILPAAQADSLVRALIDEGLTLRVMRAAAVQASLGDLVVALRGLSTGLRAGDCLALAIALKASISTPEPAPVS